MHCSGLFPWNCAGNNSIITGSKLPHQFSLLAEPARHIWLPLRWSVISCFFPQLLSAKDSFLQKLRDHNACQVSTVSTASVHTNILLSRVLVHTQIMLSRNLVHTQNSIIQSFGAHPISVIWSFLAHPASSLWTWCTLKFSVFRALVHTKMLVSSCGAHSNFLLHKI